MLTTGRLELWMVFKDCAQCHIVESNNNKAFEYFTHPEEHFVNCAILDLGSVFGIANI